MTAQPVTLRAVDWHSDHKRRNEWAVCPVCQREHPTEFVWTGEHWLGFCRSSGRMVEAEFEDGDTNAE